MTQPPDHLPVVERACPLCAGSDTTPVWHTPDRAFGVPGRYSVVRCRRCSFLFQNPRVRDDCLAACYPTGYPRHQEPSPRVPFTGSASRVRAARWALSRRLGYRAFEDRTAGVAMRIRARFMLRRLRWTCPPWRGEGRWLDVGCGSGSVLGLAQALGWRTAGIEMDAGAATRARPFAHELHVGDVLTAPFEPGRFDLVTAFHVLEHVPDPIAMLRRMLDWLAPGGIVIVEVPNAGGLGARLFGASWSSLELPRHLSHFTPRSLEQAVQAAGGRVAWCWHRAQPRHFLWSLEAYLADHGYPRFARAATPLARSVLKPLLELVLPVVERFRYGEVIRVGVLRASDRRDSTLALTPPLDPGGPAGRHRAG